MGLLSYFVILCVTFVVLRVLGMDLDYLDERVMMSMACIFWPITLVVVFFYGLFSLLNVLAEVVINWRRNSRNNK